MSLIDIHEIATEKIIDLHGSTVTLFNPAGDSFAGVKCLFNGVDHGINLDSVSTDPMVAKTNLYIQLKELAAKGIVIDEAGWIVRGKRGKYESEFDFLADAPKKDAYLPGIILFLSIINSDTQDWGSKVI